MPEGDTIFRAARTLDLALAGRLLTGFDTVLPALRRVHDDHSIVGRTVVGVRAVGKHLLIELTGDLLLRTHMRMSGSWHVYRPGERWRRPRSAMRVLLANDEYVAVAFDVPVAEFLTRGQLPRHRELAALGPDLLDAGFDEAAARANLLARGDRAVAEALLDQRVMAGVGNVFKSEVLFVCGVNPWRPVVSLTAEESGRLVAEARALLRANVAPTGAAPSGRRTTRSMDPAARLWVYGRAGRRCRRCGTTIECRAQGRDARLTYWCPACQPDRTAPPG